MSPLCDRNRVDVPKSQITFLSRVNKLIRPCACLRAQGDREAAEGLAVSPLCDRDRVDVPKSQITLQSRVWGEQVKRPCACLRAQGDREAAEGLAVSPLCDRDRVDVPKSQITFLDFVVAPCFEALRGLAPATAEAALANIGVARAHWQDQPRRNPSTMFALDDLP